MVSERRRDRGEFGVSAVGVPPRVAGLRAQILVAAPAVSAYPAGVPQPRDADPVADVELTVGVGADVNHLADHFVSGRHPVPVHREIALGDMQIGAAHSASTHGDQKLRPSGLRDRRADVFQRFGADRTRVSDLPRAHRGGDGGGHRYSMPPITTAATG